MLNMLFFGIAPYLAVVLLVGVSVTRYLKEPYTYSSLSSQFLESKRLFWGSVPFHVGIITLFFGHLIGFLVPRSVTWWNGRPVRLLILEATAMVAAFLVALGLLGLAYRRAASDRLRANTTWLDVATYVALLAAIGTGLWVAIGERWGSSWYVHTAVPYLWSLVKLSPDLTIVTQLPLAVRLHIIATWVLLGLFSFTRLVHVLVAPVPYLWRPFQLVIWNRDRSGGAR